MLVIYNREELEKAMEDFYLSTGVNINLVDKNMNCICGLDSRRTQFCKLINSSEIGKKRCLKSDCEIALRSEQSGKFEIHTCHAGLVDSAVPIKYGGSIIAFILLGQMKKEKSFAEIKHLISDFNIDEKTLENAYKKMPFYNEEKIHSIANVASYLTEYIIFKDMIKSQNNKVLSDAYIFISSNLNKPISVEDICKNIGVSKSGLYSVFSKYENCTVGEYIAKNRVEYAKSLLKFGNKSMMEISEQAGFSNYTYFCKVFKKYSGLTPLKYRKLYEA